MEGTRSLKNAKEIEVTVIDPNFFQVYRAAYSCSAAARVFRYHGLPLYYESSAMALLRGIQSSCKLTRGM